MNTNKYLGYAMSASEESIMPQSHGAVIWSSNGTVIGTGCNSHKTRINGINVPSVHAEMECMKSIKGTSV
jgi:tRNA(Arg) A34 adenosine deaminase TadA